MAERSDQRSRDAPDDTIADFSVVDDDRLDPPAQTSDGADDADTASLRSRLPALPSLPSGRMLLITMVAFAGLGILGRVTVPLLGGPLGLFVGAFSLGALSDRRRYLESAIVGGSLGVLGAALGNVRLLAITDAWLPLLGLGLGLGILIALIGTYFGNDLRRGILSDV